MAGALRARHTRFWYDRVVNPNQTSPPLLDEATADSIQHHTSINVAARDAHNRPSVTRAFGCRVSPERREVTVFLSPERAAAVLADLRDNGTIAVVANRPSTHETIQLKGRVSRIEPVSPADLQHMAAYLDSFVEELAVIGYAAYFVHKLDPEVGRNCLAVTFEPNAAFDQTPGPKAGEKLGAAP